VDRQTTPGLEELVAFRGLVAMAAARHRLQLRCWSRTSASSRRARCLCRHRFRIFQHPTLCCPLGRGAGLILIAGCDSKLSASFAKNAWRSGRNIPPIVVRMIRPCSHLSFIELIARRERIESCIS
jgi:hypothetical protein